MQLEGCLLIRESCFRFSTSAITLCFRTMTPDGPERPANSERAANSWTFLSNHAHVLLCLAMNTDARIRDIAVLVGLTERAVQRILGELAADGVVDVFREGRRNRYQINQDAHLRHPLEAHRTVRDLIRLVRKR